MASCYPGTLLAKNPVGRSGTRQRQLLWSFQWRQWAQETGETMSDDENAEPLTCGVCRKTGSFTAPVSVILVFAPGMAKPYPLIPAEDYRVCGACDAIFTLVNRAVEAHPTTRSAGPWTRAIVVFSDGHGVDVKAKRQGQQVAMA